MNRTALAQRIEKLPGLTDSERADLLKLLREENGPAARTYGLLWENKPEQVEEDLRDKLPVLREVAERRITAKPMPASGSGGSNPVSSASSNQLTIDLNEPKQTDTGLTAETAMAQTIAAPPHHLLIEGDNLHALTVLNYTHAGKVDVIYIDPPYNTGNKDFKYNDRFVDREDSYRHSKWLSFMYKRLELARNLLKPEGVIFISIDDNEQAQLKLLCDRVFGEENFVANVIWQKKYSPQNDATNFSVMHDYVLCSAKSLDRFKINLMPRSDKQDKAYKNPDNDYRGLWKASDLTRAEHRDRDFYGILTPSGKMVYPAKGRSWSRPPEEIERLRNDKRLWFGTKGDAIPSLKRFISEVKEGVVPVTFWFRDECGDNQEAKQELKDIIHDDNPFNTPKPTRLIQRTIQIGGPKNALVLDFFAGSGTTLHAVMALNAEDGGNRQCILVTNNENNIAEEVCYERNRRVIQGYTNSKGAEVPGLTNNHLHYYQTAYVGRERSLANKRDLMQLASELLSIKEGCYLEQPQASGNVRLFTNDNQTSYFVVVYDEDAIADAVALIQDITPTQALVNVYVFAPGFYPYTDDFEEVANRINLVALPEAIYQAYARLLPPMGEPVPVADGDDSIASLPTDGLSLFPLNA